MGFDREYVLSSSVSFQAFQPFNQVSTGSTMSIGLFYDDHNHITQAMTIVLLYVAGLPSYSRIKFFRVNCSDYRDIIKEARITKVRGHCCP